MLFAAFGEYKVFIMYKNSNIGTGWPWVGREMQRIVQNQCFELPKLWDLKEQLIRESERKDWKTKDEVCWNK